MVKRKSQRWEVYEYNSVKGNKPKKGELVVVRDSSVTVGGKMLVSLLVGDEVSTIEQLRGNVPIDLSTLQQNVNVLADNLNTHVNKTDPHSATSTPTASRIAMFDTGGRLKSGAAPLAATDVVRKAEADALQAEIDQVKADGAGVSLGIINSKLDKKPDGVTDLIGSTGKINQSYIPDTILGSMVYGGVFDTTGTISASSFAMELNGKKINTVAASQYPGYYFVSQGSYSFAGISFDAGDWAVCQGNHTPAWAKIDTSDAVSSVCGKTGAVVLVKADVGLGNVDNTPDINKPVSGPQQAAITAEAQARQQADTALQANLNSEVQGLQQADTVLQNNISAESQARQTVDGQLQSAITAEAQARQQADSQLQILVNNFQTNLSDEIQTRGQDDSQLQTAINTETQFRQQADTNIQTAINTEIQDRQQGEAALQSAINSEVQARQIADITLQSGINDKLDTKLEKKPDGITELIGTDGKINTEYIPDTILGAMVYGGVFNSIGTISASSFALELNNKKMVEVITAQYPGYYFVSQGAYTFAGISFDAGDWAVCQGNHTPAWAKIDTSDAVTSVNGKTGAVILTRSDVGLENVDNTSDLDKPLSIAQQAEISAEIQDRQQADQVLQSNIAAEVQQRTIDDGQLQTALTAEAQDRQTADQALQLNKLDKKPDGTNELIGTDGKINTEYIPDTILGAMVYGGVFNSIGTISASSYAEYLDGKNLTEVTTSQYPGYYFVSQGTYTFSDIDFEAGDWAVCQGDHSPSWVKIDTSDAVTSVNGKKGTVVLIKNDVGLDNVDNTSDIDKPVSTDQQAALTAEAQARQQADQTLQENITTESQSRQSADTALQAVIDALDTAISTALALKANINSETLTGIPKTPTPDGTIPAQITNVNFVKLITDYIQGQIDAVTPMSYVTLDGAYYKSLNGLQFVTIDE